MSIAIYPEAGAGPQSIRSTVSRLDAGFQHMRALGAELATLDAVGQDIRHTQAVIRRDVANAVLQTAFSVKSCRDAIPDPGELTTAHNGSESVAKAIVPDQWTKRLLRWADQLGRDLFGLPRPRSRTAKDDPALAPPQKR